MNSEQTIRKTLLINCANLHSGGGLQVAVAFLSDLNNHDILSARLGPKVWKILWVSSKVFEQLNVTLTDLETVFDSVKVVDLKGLRAMYRSPSILNIKPDLIFTVFGPNYMFGGKYRITGFAQPWIIYPSRRVYSKFSGLMMKLRTLIKFELQWLTFKREDRLVVELPHVKAALVNYRHFCPSKVSVVSNSLNPHILSTDVHSCELASDTCSLGLEFGLVSRAYPHKNIDFAINIIGHLRRNYSLDARLHLTITESEAADLKLKDYPFVINHGPVTLSRLPNFYSQIDHVIFPTLLECFSAIPLEAFYFEKTLFCSDLEFMKDCAVDHAIYFTPYDVDAATKVVAEFLALTNEKELLARVAKAKAYVLNLPSSIDRTTQFVEIIADQLLGKNVNYG